MGKLIDADELKAVYIPSGIEGFEKMMVPVEVVLQNIDDMPTVDAVPVVRCKDCSQWCICHHSDNWFCADGTPINTASDFYDDKGKRLNNPQTYKSIYGERKDGDSHD